MKKVRPIELWQVAMIVGAHRASKNVYSQSGYRMCVEYKSGNTWKYCGWSIPGIPHKAKCYIKTNPSGEYLYIELGNGDVDRYKLNDMVKKILDI